MRSFLALLLLVPASLSADVQNPENILFEEAVEEGRRTLYVDSLQKFTEFLYLYPRSSMAEKARQEVWQLTQKINETRKRWELSDAERRDLVHRAQQMEDARRRREVKLLEELDAVGRKTGGDPGALVSALGGSAALSDAAQVSFVQELEGLKAQQSLDRIREALKAQVRNGDLRNPKALHEAQGFLNLYEKDLEGAVKEWALALDQDPSDAALRGNLDKARAELAAQKRLEDIQDALAEGRDFYGVGDYARAQESFQRAASLDPANGEARQYSRLAAERGDERRRQLVVSQKLDQARKLMESGSSLEAVPLLAEVLELDPQNERAHRQLESVMRKFSLKASLSSRTPPAPGGKQASPAPTADRAAAEEAYTMGMVHYVQNDLDKAIEFFKKALELDPSFPQAARALEQTRVEKSGK